MNIRPFTNFIQINNEETIYSAEDWLIENSPIAYRILRFLMKNMDKHNAVICSYLVLQEKFGISKETVRKSIKILKDKKYLDVLKSGSANVYTINKKIAWKSAGKNYKHAKFSANIILSVDEQDEKTRK